MADHFEGKLHAFRRTQDGVVISYVVHPNDVSAAMATAALGTRYMIAFEAMTDNSEPTGNPARSGPYKAGLGPDSSGNLAGVTDRKDGHQSKDRRPFASLPLSQQAALRCQDKTFIDFLEQLGLTTALEDDWDPAEVVRIYCRISSRAELDKPTPNPAKDHWTRLNGQYEAYLTDRQYADTRR